MKSKSNFQWGELRTGWGQAVFVLADQGLVRLQLETSTESYQTLIEQKLAPQGVRKLTPGERSLWAQKISEALAHPSLISRLPISLQGSEFQVQVWQSLMQIPRGQTLTYSELAAQVGRPQAVRAVASACAANPLALLVPCHRVLRKDGSLGGYRWGTDLKRRLLQHEGAI